MVDPSVQPRLYQLAPIGRGTARVEALTGYVARLARRHCLPAGRLILSEIAPHLGSYDPAGPRLLARVIGDVRTGPLDGSGPRSEDWVATLQVLTHLSGLRELTTASWKGAVGNHDLLRPEAAYCPARYALDLETMTENGRHEPYERLAWRLAGVEVCLVHATSLQTRCMWCDRSRRPLAYWSLPGYCPFCRRWLGINGTVEPRSPGRWQIKSTQLIEDALSGRTSDPETQRIVDGIATVIEATTGGNRTAFARMIGLRSSGTITEWFTGVKPSLGSLVRIAAAVGSDLTSILDGRPSVGRHEPTEPPMSTRHRRHESADWAAIETQVMREAEATDPMRLAAIARAHSVRVQDIRNRLPGPARVLVDQGNRARSRQAGERRQRLESALASVMSDLRRAGKERSRRNIEPRLPDGASLHEPALRDAWRRGR